MVNASELRHGLAVLASNGDPLGTVDSVIGERVKLTRRDSIDDKHHYVPLAWIARVDDCVRLNRTGADVRMSWGELGGAAAATAAIDAHEGAGQASWLPWLLLSLGVLALLFAFSRYDRGNDDPVSDTAVADASGVAGS